jgi:hypothetical protein
MGNSKNKSAICHIAPIGSMLRNGAYWKLAPGEPSFYWLPPESRVKQIKLLKGFAGLKADVKIYDYARTSG